MRALEVILPAAGCVLAAACSCGELDLGGDGRQDGDEPDSGEDGVDLPWPDAGDANADEAHEWDGADLGEDEVVRDPASPNCPIWAVPLPTGGPEDGSEIHPYVGLDRAVEARGTCDTIVLRDGTLETPFDAAVSISLAAGETLTIEGDPATEAPAELDAHDDPGISVTGDGTLVLRHLAVRRGRGSPAGCFDAQVHAISLEDTEFSGCRAEDGCSAARIEAEEILVSDSRFLRNTGGGALCLEGPPDTTHVLVERSRFEDNTVVDWLSALSLQVLTRDSVVRDCVFLRNRARNGPVALAGTLGELSHNRFEANEIEMELAIVNLRGTPETRILHNIFIDNHCGRGQIALTVTRGLVSNNLFVRNTCINAPDSGWCTAAVWITHAGNVDLRNNTFVDNESDDGIAHLSYDSAFGQVRSNLFVGGTGAAAVGTDYPEWGVSTEMSYNAWWNVPEPVWGEGVRLGVGNIEADPLFSGIDDFQLGPGSAAIDAGDPDPALLDPDGTRNDIGAFGGPDGDWTPLPEGGLP